MFASGYNGDDLHDAYRDVAVLQELYDIAEGKAVPGEGDPTVVFSMDEFGPLKRRSDMGRSSVNTGKQRSFPDDRGAQKKINLAGQVKNLRSVP